MRSTIGENLAAFQRLYRFSDWFHFLGFVFLGILFAARQRNIDWLPTFQVAVASVLLLAFAYSFNVLFDSKLESPASTMDGTIVKSGRGQLLLSLLPAAGGMVLLTRSLEVFFLGLLFVLLWGLYSFPSPRLKAIPILCTIINGVGFSLLFLIGFAFAAPISSSALVFFSLLVLLEIPAQLIHEVSHSEADAPLAINTTAVQYGMKRSLDSSVASLLGAVALVAGMVIGGLVNIFTTFVAGSFASVFTVVFLRERNAKYEIAPSERSSAEQSSRLRREYKYGGILAGVALALTLLL